MTDKIIEEIIEEVKALNDEQLIEFNTKFKEVYKRVETNLKKAKNEAKKKKEQEQLDKAHAIAVKLCDLLKIKAIPYTGCTKAWDAPYKPYVCEDDIICEEFCESLKGNYDEKTIDEAAELLYDFMGELPSSYFFEDKDAEDSYPGSIDFMFYNIETKSHISVSESQFMNAMAGKALKDY